MISHHCWIISTLGEQGQNMPYFLFTQQRSGFRVAIHNLKKMIALHFSFPRRDSFKTSKRQWLWPSIIIYLQIDIASAVYIERLSKWKDSGRSNSFTHLITTQQTCHSYPWVTISYISIYFAFSFNLKLKLGNIEA